MVVTLPEKKDMLKKVVKLSLPRKITKKALTAREMDPS